MTATGSHAHTMLTASLSAAHGGAGPHTPLAGKPEPSAVCDLAH